MLNFKEKQTKLVNFKGWTLRTPPLGPKSLTVAAEGKAAHRASIFLF